LLGGQGLFEAKILAVANVGFVGLGVMGGPMAGHLVQNGHRLTVWNRTQAKTEPLAAAGAIVAGSLTELAKSSDIVFLCVSRSEDVDACIESMIPTARSGALFIDHSTILPAVAILIHTRLRDSGHAFLDAPITGGSIGAQMGQLTIFCGGDHRDFDRAAPVMASYAKRAELVGGPGAGQTMKLANQIAVGGALLALCESLAFAKKAGLDIAQTRELLATGAAGSWAFENYGPKIINDDWSPGFSVKNQRKDFAYALEAAENLDAAVPGTALVDRLLAALDEQGHSDWTTAALYKTMLESGFDTWM